MTWYKTFKVLSPKEQEEQLEIYRKTGDIKCKERLVMSVLSMILRRIRTYPIELQEDAYSEAALAICIELERFKSVGGCSFNAFAYIAARGAMWRFSKKVSRYVTTGEEFFSCTTTPDHVETISLIRGIESLTEKQQEAVLGVHLFGNTYIECAELLGVGRSSINKRLNASQKKLSGVL